MITNKKNKAKKHDNKLKFTLGKNNVIYVQVNDYVLRKVKARNKFTPNSFVPLQSLYLLAFDTLQYRLDSLIDLAIDGKIKSYPMDAPLDEMI